jgi:hypothetical protein
MEIVDTEVIGQAAVDVDMEFDHIDLAELVGHNDDIGGKSESEPVAGFAVPTADGRIEDWHKVNLVEDSVAVEVTIPDMDTHKEAVGGDMEVTEKVIKAILWRVRR